MPRPIIDLIGQRFGKLVVKEFIEAKIIKGNHETFWKCICDCGNVKTSTYRHLVNYNTKSCGCLRIFKKGEANFNALFKGYSRRAKKKQMDFTLSKEEFRVLVTQNCYYCNIAPYQIADYCDTYNGPFVHCGIDRINNSKGYVLLNCVSCCKYCNSTKRSISYELAKKFVNLYEERFPNG